MQPKAPYVPTTVSQAIVARMQRTHEKRRISIFSGPPGIGKTSAIDQFKIANDYHVVVLKISNKNTSDLVAYQYMLEGFAKMTEQEYSAYSADRYAIKNQLCRRIADWGGGNLPWPLASATGQEPEVYPNLTFVFDEAQNLSRHAVDALRYWNDPDRCYGPFPIGVIFIGNNEFALKADRSGTSVISAAVADRALYHESFDYSAVKASDLELFVRSRGIAEPNAVAALVRRYSGPRVARSLRRLSDDIDELFDEADGSPVTLATVKAVFSPD
jgi:DNA polymerase III delta prime subunit